MSAIECFLYRGREMWVRLWGAAIMAEAWL